MSLLLALAAIACTSCVVGASPPGVEIVVESGHLSSRARPPTLRAKKLRSLAGTSNNTTSNSTTSSSTTSSSTTSSISGGNNNSNNSNNTATTTTTAGISGGSPLGGSYLDPSSSTSCPAKCRNYFAGARASDAMVCQKQASGVGTAEQNAALGVACYPAYGCGRDMITCVSQDWSGALPDTSDAAAACAGLQGLTAEKPWTCGTAEEGRTACAHNQPNNAAGQWLKATADLNCGWGSTYGNVRPGYTGEPAPASVFFEGVTSDYECCLKAMQFETTSWSEGGAALLFQQGLNLYGNSGDYCRVDREKIIYGNLDSSSGRSIKYQDTRCGDNNFYYRHAAGAADAANLHTGGRCVLEGNFTRLALSSGTNLPKGELPEGWELPNHRCPDNPTGFNVGSGCHVTVKFNTINDAEECCKMCKDLSWFSPEFSAAIGDNAELDPTTGLQVNPCVAWQIVSGRCRITRKTYFDHYNSGISVGEAIVGTSDPDWDIKSRGCGDSVERCNYNSFIYYRDLAVAPDGSNASDAAIYRKIVTLNVSAATESLDLNFDVNSLDTRQDRRRELAKNASGDESSPTPASVGNGTDCGRLEVFLSEEALRSVGSDGFMMFDEEKKPQPLCVSECLGSGGSATITCQLLAGGVKSSRRLAAETPGSLVFSFTAVGSGYDQVDFSASTGARVVKMTTSTTTASTSTADQSTTTGSASTTPRVTTTAESGATTAESSGISVTTTTSMKSAATSVTVSGTIGLTVSNASSFVSDPAAKAGIAKSIATLGGVDVAQVSVTLKITGPGRRLLSRQLQMGMQVVEVSYIMTLTIPVSAASASAGTSLGNKISGKISAVSSSELSKAMLDNIKSISGTTYDLTVTMISAPTLAVEAATTTIATTTTTNGAVATTTSGTSGLDRATPSARSSWPLWAWLFALLALS